MGPSEARPTATAHSIPRAESRTAARIAASKVRASARSSSPRSPTTSDGSARLSRGGWTAAANGPPASASGARAAAPGPTGATGAWYASVASGAGIPPTRLEPSVVPAPPLESPTAGAAVSVALYSDAPTDGAVAPIGVMAPVGKVS